MTAFARNRARGLLIHAVLFIVLGIWMVPQVYMLSVGLRTAGAGF